MQCQAQRGRSWRPAATTRPTRCLDRNDRCGRAPVRLRRSRPVPRRASFRARAGRACSTAPAGAGRTIAEAVEVRCELQRLQGDRLHRGQRVLDPVVEFADQHVAMLRGELALRHVQHDRGGAKGLPAFVVDQRHLVVDPHQRTVGPQGALLQLQRRRDVSVGSARRGFRPPRRAPRPAAARGARGRSAFVAPCAACSAEASPPARGRPAPYRAAQAAPAPPSPVPAPTARR